MNTGAIIMMITVESIAIALTGYFFYKVLVTKPHNEDEMDDNTES
jgi:hypothetical protein